MCSPVSERDRMSEDTWSVVPIAFMMLEQISMARPQEGWPCVCAILRRVLRGLRNFWVCKTWSEWLEDNWERDRSQGAENSVQMGELRQLWPELSGRGRFQREERVSLVVCRGTDIQEGRTASVSLQPGHIWHVLATAKTPRWLGMWLQEAGENEATEWRWARLYVCLQRGPKIQALLSRCLGECKQREDTIHFCLGKRSS